ncbi:MAG TPA: alpha/beta hydrolase [Bacteroidetes bacterium]|nr:alpha/beta hydrolase [Bacteroidota bacterium]
MGSVAQPLGCPGHRRLRLCKRKRRKRRLPAQAKGCATKTQKAGYLFKFSFPMVNTNFIEVLPAFQLQTLPEEKAKYPLPLKAVRLAFNTLGRLFPQKAGAVAFRFFTQPRLRAVHRRTDEILESARLFEILYGKLILKAYEWGSGKKTVLLVHGWESRGTALRGFVPGLLRAGYRVVAFDGPAHGDSGGKRTTLVEFAGAIKAVVQQVGGVDSIISHSFGGVTSVYALTQLNLGIELEKLVLIAVPSNIKMVVKDAMQYMNVPPAAAKYFERKLKKQAEHLTFDDINIEASIGKAKVGSVLMVHDKFDRSVPFESAERVMDRWGHVNFLVTQGLGHFKLMKNGEVIERVVGFVAGTTPIPDL